jgi:MFS family permease
MWLLHGRVAWLAAVVYFVQGSLGITGVALPLFLRDQGFSIAKITFISSVSAAPWFFKIIYGAVSDAFPIWRLRRKPYLVLYSACSCLGWILMAFVPAQEYWLIAAMMTSNLGLAATDVITDALVVEHSRTGTAQIYQSIAWGARSAGAVVSGIVGGILAAKLNPRWIFLITGSLPLISLIVAARLPEKPEASSKRGSIRGNILIPILESVRYILRGDLKWFCLFIFLASSSAAFGTPFFFYMRETLKFDEVFLGILNSIVWFGAIIGCWIFLKFFRRIALRKTLYWAVGIGFINILLILLVKDHATAFFVWFFSGILGYLILLPIFSSAAKLSHATGVEGSLFAILMSLFNLGQAASGYGGGYLYGFIGLNPLIVLTAFLFLASFLVIPRLKTL